MSDRPKMSSVICTGCGEPQPTHPGAMHVCPGPGGNPSREITRHERDFGFAPDAFPERPSPGERPPTDEAGPKVFRRNDTPETRAMWNDIESVAKGPLETAEVAAIRQRWARVTPGPWGPMNDGPQPRGMWEPWQAHMEPRPGGLTIASPHNTEPICRVSGYLQPVTANAQAIASAPEDIAFLLGALQVSRALTEALRAAAPQQPDGTTCPKCGVEVVVAPTPIHPWWCPSCHERGTLRAAAPQPDEAGTSDLVGRARRNRAAMPGMLSAALEDECLPLSQEAIDRLAQRITARLDVWPRDLADPVLPAAAPGASPAKQEVEMSKTLDWPDPTPEMLNDPRFVAVWQCIKGWDISTGHEREQISARSDLVDTGTHRLYSGATGNHVRAILDALGVGASPAEPDKGETTV